jgi:uncharacterized protein (UPF0332 family)
MSLEELLRNRAISRIRPSHKLAQNTISRARRDVDTAKTLVANEKFDWSLAASYNAMLLAGRALMLDRGYRPSRNYQRFSGVKHVIHKANWKRFSLKKLNISSSS